MRSGEATWQLRPAVSRSPTAHIIAAVPQVSEQCWTLVRALLAVDPALRPSLAAIAAHPWVRAGTSPELLRLNDELLSQARDALGHASEPAHGHRLSSRAGLNTTILIASSSVDWGQVLAELVKVLMSTFHKLLGM